MSEQSIVFLILMAMLLGTGIALVLTEHYGWAWIPFLIAAFIGFESGEKQKPQVAPDKPAATYVFASGLYPPCVGRNCGATDGVSHSPECKADHTATVEAAARIEELERVLKYLLGNEPDGSPCVTARSAAYIRNVLKGKASRV